MPEPGQPEWFAEPPFGGYQQRYRLRQRLHERQTEFQRLQVLDLEPVGRALILDGTLQTSLGEEFTYHEPLVHIPMFSHPSPRRVLIIGGGDGGALRHVLLHPYVERVVEVEIDRGVVEASLAYLPEISCGAYQDPRVELIIADGVRYLTESRDRFDVILVDSTDPVGPAAELISDAFLRTARRALAPGGLAAMQSGSPLTQPREWLVAVQAFRRRFSIVRPFLGFVPIYPGVLWSWVIGSDEVEPTRFDEVTVAARLSSFTEVLRIYNPAQHRAAFALPNYLHRMIEHDGTLDEALLRAVGHPLPGVVRT